VKRMNSYGPSVFAQLTARPLWSLWGVEMVNGVVNATGFALPRDAAGNGVTWEADDGVAFTVDYPLPSPGPEEVYWYWTGAERSGFRVAIDLAASRHRGDFFRFRIRFDGVDDTENERIRTTFLIPKSLQMMQNFPHSDALQRTHRFHSMASVALHGASDANRIAAIGRRHGADLSSAAVLDWGCGHGRVVRFLPHFGFHGPLHGIDIDPENIAWAQSHLDAAAFAVGPLYPPLPYAESSFDLLYGISVMTHLPSEVQRVWLAEIRRVLRPGGLALLTFTGDSATAFASRYLTDEWLAAYLASGQGPDLPSKDLVGVVENGGDYYRNVNQTLSVARARCAEYLAVLEAQECAFGYQDLLVLRKEP